MFHSDPGGDVEMGSDGDDQPSILSRAADVVSSMIPSSVPEMPPMLYLVGGRENAHTYYAERELQCSPTADWLLSKVQVF